MAVEERNWFDVESEIPAIGPELQDMSMWQLIKAHGNAQLVENPTGQIEIGTELSSRISEIVEVRGLNSKDETELHREVVDTLNIYIRNQGQDGALETSFKPVVKSSDTEQKAEANTQKPQHKPKHHYEAVAAVDQHGRVKKLRIVKTKITEKRFSILPGVNQPTVETARLESPKSQDSRPSWPPPPMPVA